MAMVTPPTGTESKPQVLNSLKFTLALAEEQEA